MGKRLYFGVIEPEVLELNLKLIAAGARIPVPTDMFNIETYVALKAYQENEGLTADGWCMSDSGPTWEHLSKAKPGDATPNPRPTVPVIVEPKPDIVIPGDELAKLWGNALHIKNEFLPRNGWTEFSHDKELAKFCWPPSKFKSNSVIGSQNAWCEGGQNGMWWNEYEQSSFTPAAVGSKDVGIEADDYWFGCRVHTKHKGGGNHAFAPLYWEDKAKKLLACAGFNQNNAVNITIYNVSGNKNGHDELSPPRWPKGVPKGRMMTKAEVQLLIKNAGVQTGGSTR